MKYGPVGGEVVVRTAREGPRVVLTVEDQGAGIPVAEADPSGGEGGSGIGSVLSRRPGVPPERLAAWYRTVR